jgi:hypothetical protein
VILVRNIWLFFCFFCFFFFLVFSVGAACTSGVEFASSFFVCEIWLVEFENKFAFIWNGMFDSIE